MNGRGQQWLDWAMSNGRCCQDENGPDDQQDWLVNRDGRTSDSEGEA